MVQLLWLTGYRHLSNINHHQPFQLFCFCILYVANVIRQDIYSYLNTVERDKIPSSCLDPLCGTRDLNHHQDCGSSCLLPRYSRQDSLNQHLQLNMAIPLTTDDTYIHLQSLSSFPCTHAPAESFYILDKRKHLHLKYLTRYATSAYFHIVVKRMLTMHIFE